MSLRGQLVKLCEAKNLAETSEAWRSQEHVSSKETSRKEQNWPKREAMGNATTGSAIRVEPPKPFKIHILPLIASDAAYETNGTTGLNVYPVRFWITLVPSLCYPLVSNFGMEMSILCHGMLEVSSFLFICAGAPS